MTATVHGRVQGVSFRYYTLLAARRIGVVGYARNQRDGTVLVVAEGSDAQLNELAKWLNEGSPAAIVRRVEQEFSEATGDFGRFEIRY